MFFKILITCKMLKVFIMSCFYRFGKDKIF